MKRIVVISRRSCLDVNLIRLLSEVFPECRIECLDIHRPPDLNRRAIDVQHEGDRHEHQKAVSQDQTRLQGDV